MSQALIAEPRSRGGGRPRNEATRRSILSTTIKLLERETVQSITIEAIARAAGVSKATIYRWWTSKAAVVIDAFIEHHIVKTPMPRGVPPGDAIATHMRLLTEQYGGWPGRIVAQIIAEGQSDPQITREFRERFHYGRRAVVREVLDQWRKSGDIDPAIDVETLMDLLYSPIYMRLLVGHAPLDAAFIDQQIDFVFKLLGAKPSPR